MLTQGPRAFRWSRPGDTLVSNEIDGPQHVRPAGALNRAGARRILRARITEDRAASRAAGRSRWTKVKTRAAAKNAS